jgi:hypothetical protein
MHTCDVQWQVDKILVHGPTDFLLCIAWRLRDSVRPFDWAVAATQQ